MTDAPQTSDPIAFQFALPAEHVNCASISAYRDVVRLTFCERWAVGATEMAPRSAIVITPPELWSIMLTIMEVLGRYPIPDALAERINSLGIVRPTAQETPDAKA